MKNKNLAVAFAIGNRQKSVRKLVVKMSSQILNLCYPNLIDPSCNHITKSAIYGQGNIICTSVIMTTNIEIGNFNLIMQPKYCTIGHDDEIRRFYIPCLSGSIYCQEMVTFRRLRSEIGTGTQIIQGTRITDQ